MLHAYVRRFDVTDTVGKILATKQGLSQNLRLFVRAPSPEFGLSCSSFFVKFFSLKNDHLGELAFSNFFFHEWMHEVTYPR